VTGLPAAVTRRLDELSAAYHLPAGSAERLGALLTALAAEPDPHTTVSDPRRAVDAHVADSLAALEIPAVRSARAVADLGAGAGFPGLPLAVALPDAEVALVESTARKCAVIDRLAAAAGVGNARAVQARAEEWPAGIGAHDLVTARALAPLPVIAEYAAPLLAPSGTLVAWKGQVDGHELEAARRAAEELGLEQAEIVEVPPFPGASGHTLHLYLKVGSTPNRYPRRAGIARKRPLGTA
jgi:16S rRNA (guanine527-N7)-methyltransferase